MKRAVNRAKLDRATNIELVESMWGQFHSLNEYERYVLETTGLPVDETILMIKDTISKKTNLLA